MAVRSSGSGNSSSITDVAALAEVSTATVSRVLSGRRTKDDDISRRVHAAARKLNYSVNYAASSLRSDVTNTIGLLIPSATDHFSARLLDALEPVVDTDNRQLLLAIGTTQQLQADRIESLAARHVDGLIVVTATGADLAPTLERFAQDIPIVQVGGRRRSFHSSMVSVDENAAMQMSIGHLAERGAASVAYLAGKEISFESAELFALFHTQMRSFGLTTHTDWNQFGDRTVQRGYQCAMRLFGGPGVAKYGRPDALLCEDDAIAFGAMMALRTLGIDVPADVKIIGYNDSQIANAAMPTITSVRPPFDQIVSEALRLISLGPSHPTHVSMPPELIVRGSTAA